jgi:hypothetical protein
MAFWEFTEEQELNSDDDMVSAKNTVAIFLKFNDIACPR